MAETSSSRLVWHSAGLVLAALVAYLAWRGYQSPDFMLDLVNTWQLC